MMWILLNKTIVEYKNCLVVVLICEKRKKDDVEC